MKILIVTTTWKPELSGIAEATYSRVMELSRIEACNIRVLAPDYSEYALTMPNYGDYVGRISANVEVKTYPTRIVESITKVSTEARLVQPFWKYDFEHAFGDFGPDVIHVEEPCRLFGLRLFDGHLRRIGVSYKRRRRIPATCMWRTDYFEYAKTVYGPRVSRMLTASLRPVFSWVYNAYDRTFCSSSTAQAKLTWAGVENLRLVHSHGIDVNKFQRRAAKRDHGTYRLLYVGRVSKEKNIGQLLAAFGVLSKRYPTLRLNVVGSGPHYDALRVEYAADARVTFHGKVANDELPRIYSENDVFVNPSHTETFGLSTLEACACSMPVVVADKGGFLTESDEAQFRCLRYKHDDCQDLARKIELLFLDRDLGTLLATNARQLATSYDHERVARNFHSEWLKLIEARDAVAPAKRPLGCADCAPLGEADR
jgi:glycosyltransferase involved in cell wall biosynthesis